MRAYLNQDPDSASGRQQNVAKLIHFAVGESSVPPALFEAIADFPGLTAEDGAGRPGTGVSWTGGETTTLVLDPATRAFVGFADVESVTTRAVVDDAGQRP